MAFIPLAAMVRKDLLLFFSDRRSVIVSFVVPIAIASFFGSIFSGPGNNAEPARIAVSIVDHDSSAISKAIVAAADADKNFRLTRPDEAGARDAVKRGRTSVTKWKKRGPDERVAAGIPCSTSSVSATSAPSPSSGSGPASASAARAAPSANTGDPSSSAR